MANLKQEERNNYIVYLREERGWTYEKIAKFHGIKRNTAYEIYQRNKDLSTS